MSEFIPLPKSFYEPSAAVVAPALLGHWLIRNTSEGIIGGPIVEVEAYLWDDPACHAARGTTPRNRIMFGLPGHAYVYLIYGYHYCVNAVCRPTGIAEAVLIRAIEAAEGESAMRSRRTVSQVRHLTDGPAKLCQALDIDRSLDGVDLCDATAPLYVGRNPAVAAWRRQHGPVVITERVGITRAATLPLRFYLEGSHFVSRRAKSKA